MLSGRKILVGVTGSIAAYKTAVLVRLLVKEGAEVKVVMTSSAHEFITPVTLSTLSKNPVTSDFVKKSGTGEWNNHVELGLWADEFIIAPASANTLAKMAQGLCDNLLLATYLSARCPVMVAPAMDLDMFAHPATQSNLQILRNNNVEVLEPESGELASGLSGQGRMMEPENIVAALKKKTKNLPLAGLQALVTAGPTYEAIDPVRFIGNHSSGKMGYAIAEQLSLQGAEVQLISGPTSLTPPGGRVQTHEVTSAEQMYEKAQTYFGSSNIVVLSAAVADYKPVEVAKQKIKKSDNSLKIDLSPTPDIAATLGKLKKDQFMVGFALETDNGIENASRKLIDKNLDLIVLNSLTDPGAGFGHDTNKITILDKQNKQTNFELKSKKEVARDIINEITSRI